MRIKETTLSHSLSSEKRQIETLIASIVEVTKQREQVALEQCLGRLIVQLTDANSLTIYHLQHQDQDMLVVPVLHLSDGEAVPIRTANLRPFLLSSNPALGEQLLKPYSASHRNDGENSKEEFILPLQGVKGVTSGFCHLNKMRNNGDVYRVLPLLVEFYTNFFTLLDDNERDVLTGLLNRKTFDTRIGKILATLQTEENRTSDNIPAYCLIAVDIDHFKRINDTFGHLYGDEVLLLFANLMKKTFRENDLLFRFGGEEFVALLSLTDRSHVSIAAERFRSVVEKTSFPQVGKVTVSIGIAMISVGEMPRITMDRADRALYFAKQNGRNQVQIYEDLVENGLLKTQTIKAGDIELF